MKSCENCKIVIDEGVSLCPRCGKPVENEASPKVASRIERLLAEANLHKIRGEYDAAVDKCTEALQLQPSDPETHSLLGDIYGSSGNFEESARWYAMAIELRPACALDEAKLERARSKLLSAKMDGGEITFGGRSRALMGGSMLDVVMRYIIGFSVVGVLVLLAIGLTAWIGRQRAAEPAITPPSITRDQPDDTPVSTPPSPDAVEILVRPAAEQQVLSSLAINPIIQNRRLVVEDVKIDPRHRILTVTFRNAAPPKPLTRVGLLRDATVVAVAAFAASDDVTTVTARILIEFPNAKGVAEPHLVLVCDVPRQASSIDIGRSAEDDLGRLLSNVWWKPELAAR